MEKRGKCHLCGELSNLTLEHVPPKSAFNHSGNYLTYGFQDMAWVKKKENRYGVGEYTLCGPCNNNTGGGDAQAYVEFVKFLAIRTEGVPYRQPINLTYRCFPSRILRQVLTIFCSTSGSAFTDKHLWVRKFVLDHGTMGIPDHYRIYICLVDKQAKLSTGVAGVLNLGGSEPSITVASEFLFWPLGCFILFTDQDQQDKRLTDITAWANYKYREKVSLDITLHKNYKLTGLPMDFRSQQEIEIESGVPVKPPGSFPFI